MIKKKVKFNVTVNLVPHPNPQRVINLVAEIVLKQIVQERILY